MFAFSLTKGTSLPNTFNMRIIAIHTCAKTENVVVAVQSPNVKKNVDVNVKEVVQEVANEDVVHRNANIGHQNEDVIHQNEDLALLLIDGKPDVMETDFLMLNHAAKIMYDATSTLKEISLLNKNTSNT